MTKKVTMVISVSATNGGDRFPCLPWKKSEDRKKEKKNGNFFKPNAVKLSVQTPFVVVTYPDIV